MARHTSHHVSHPDRLARTSSRARTRRATLVAAAASGVLAGATLRAANLNWDANGTLPVNGGSGTWNTTSPLWEDGAGNYVMWNNATPDAAVFGTAAGTVTLGEAITAASATFNTANYIIDLAGNDLTVNGATGGSGAPNPTIQNTGAMANFITGSMTNVGTRVTGNINLTIGGSWNPSNTNDFSGTFTFKPTATATMILQAQTSLGTASGLMRLDATSLPAGSNVNMNWSTPDGSQFTTMTRDVELIHANATTLARFQVNGVKAVTLAGNILGGDTTNGGIQFTSGQGNLVLAGTGSTYTGTTTVSGQGSMLTLASNKALGNSTLVTGGSGQKFTIAFQGGINITDPITLNIGTNSSPPDSGYGMLHNLAGDNTFAGSVTHGGSVIRIYGAEAGSSILYTGIVGNTVGSSPGIQKVGYGTVILANAETLGTRNTTTGNETRVNEGTLRLDFSLAPTGVDTNIINNSVGTASGTSFTGNQSSGLVLGGGTLEVKGRGAGFTNSQRFKDNVTVQHGFTINAGASAVRAVQNGADSLTIDLGRLMPANRFAGGTVDFTLPTTGQIVLRTFTGAIGGDNQLLNSNGTAFATIDGSDWAAAGPVVSGQRAIVPGSSIGGFYTNNDATTLTGNADMSGGVDATLAADASINSLRFNDATAARTITATGVTLTTGGILVTPNVGNNLSTITGGTLTGQAAAANMDLVVIQNNTANALNIGSVIANNGGTATAFTKAGAGLLSLSGANTYTGQTTLTGGVTKLDNAGAMPGGIAATGGLSNIKMQGGVIGLTAASGDFLRGLGTGVDKVQFTGDGGFAAYGGNRVVNLGGASGSVTFGSNPGTAGSFILTGSALILGATDADSTVDFQNPIALRSPNAPQQREFRAIDGSAAVDGILSGVVSGDGGVTKSGSGTLQLSATDTYIGPTMVKEGALLVTGAIAGAGTVNTTGPMSISSGASVTFNNPGTSTFQGIVSGNGSFTQASAGTLILNKDSTFTGTTTIAAGTMQIGNNGAGGNWAGNITNGGVLAWNKSNTTTYVGVVSGTGSMTKSGAGTLVLPHTNNTYGGGTTLNAGAVSFAGLGSLGSGNITFAGGALRYATGNTADISSRTVTINSAGGTIDTNGNSVTIAGAIGNNGVGGLTKSGAGQLDLNGNNTYTGVTNVTAGTLAISGSNLTSSSTVNGGILLANSPTSSGTGDVTVNSGSVGGSGTIGNLTVANGGHVAPGNSAGTLTANNLTLNTGAVFDYDLSNVTTVGGGINDLLVVASGSNPAPAPTDGFTLNINATNTSLANGTYMIIDSGSALSIDPAKWTVGANNATGTYTYAFSLDANGDLVLGVTPVVVGPTESVWDKDDSVSLWSATDSWVGGVPNAVDAKATFGAKITADRTVNVDGQQIVGTLTFDNANKYTLVPGQFGGLVVVDSATTGTVTVTSGNHDIVTPVQLNKDTTFTVTPPGSTLTVSDLTATGVNVTKAGSGMLAVNRVRSNDLTVNAGTLAILPNGDVQSVSKVAALVVANGARLDISDNHLITTSPVGSAGTDNTYSGISGLIQSGRNGGDWSGSGIVTSQTTVPSTASTSIGIATAEQALNLANATDTGVWAGQVVTGSDTLLMYTYAGDANLDGKITISDYGKIDFNVGIPGASGWANGDFNYDGKITISDYGIIDFNVGIQGPPFVAGSGASAGVSGVSAVPEPASVAVFAACGVAGLARRRRRRA